MRRRVVITGLGPVTPIGTGKQAFWDSLVAGRSGVGEIKAFDTSRFRAHRGFEIKDFRLTDYLDLDPHKIPGRGAQLALTATALALADSGLSSPPTPVAPKRRWGVCLGTTGGEIQILEHVIEQECSGREETIPPHLYRAFPCNRIPEQVAAFFDCHGPVLMIPTACAAGNYAVGYAYDLLCRGKADLMLAGGVDPFSRMSFTGFLRLHAIASEKVQPFDKNRQGMMLGEGAGVMVLEPLDHALMRGASIYAEILGYGLSCDAYHMTSPEPSGQGIMAAMVQALQFSHVPLEAVDYISAHGTGTPTNDKIETHAIKKLFGPHSQRLAVSSIKSMIGHTMGAASAIETIAVALTLIHGVIPPTIHYETPDPECDLDYVPNVCRKQSIRIALNNAYAFGGNNSSVVLQRYEEKEDRWTQSWP